MIQSVLYRKVQGITDVDKGYQLGYNFDKNGMFTGWSNLFDYHSKDSLEASCYLPIPRHTTWINVNDDEDIDITNMNLHNGASLVEHIEQIYDENGNVTNTSERNKLLGTFLREISLTNGQNVKVIFDTNNIKQQAFINDIMQHEQTDLVDGRKISAYQNALSWNAQHIINDIKEVADSYVPTSVDNMKQAVKDLKLAGDSGRYNMMNPINKYILIFTNLTGKNVISVGANVQKAYFNLYNYYQGVMANPLGHTPKYYQFTKKFSRIGREPVVKSTLGNLNFGHIQEFENLSKILFMTDPTIKASLNAVQTSIYQSQEDFTRDFIKAYKYHNISEDFSKYLAGARNILDSYQPDAETITKYGTTYMLLNNSEIPESSISELLNAAADNAKELILNKINAGMNLAGVHGYLMSMGFNLQDIIAFMTTPAARVINTLTQQDIYNKTYWKSLKVNKLLEEVLLSPSKQEYWSKALLNPTTISETSDTIENKVARQLLNIVYNNVMQHMTSNSTLNADPTFKLNPITGEVTFFGNKYDSLSKLQGIFAEDSQERLLIDNVIANVQWEFQNFIKDCAELANVYRGTREMTALSQLFLSLNQGIKSTQPDQLYFESRVYQYINDMEEVFPETIQDLDKFIQTGEVTEKLQKSLQGIKNLRNEMSYEEIARDLYDCMQAGIYKNFNYKNYLLDSNVTYTNSRGTQETISYRNLAVKYYNLMKDSFNIFDLMQNSAQYSEYLNRLRDSVIESDTVSVKSTLVRYFFDELRATKEFITENTIKQIQAYIDDAYVQKYLNSTDTQYRVVADEYGKAFDKFELNSIPSSQIHTLKNSDEIATFKYWVENQLIKHLKNGYYYDVDGSRHEIGQNAFVQGLRPFEAKHKPYLSLDIDMTKKDNSATTQQKYSNYLEGFRQLGTFAYGNGTLQDIFIKYNLLVTGNKYGKHRMTTIFQEKLQQDMDNLDNPEYKPSALREWYTFQGINDSNNIQETIRNHQLENNPSYRQNIIKQYGLSITGFLKYIAPEVNNPRDSQATIVKMLSRNTYMPYYYDKNTRKDADYIEGVDLYHVSSKKAQSFLDNLVRYYPTIVDSSIIKKSYEDLFTPGNEGSAENHMYSATYSGKMKILINCA